MFPHHILSHLSRGSSSKTLAYAFFHHHHQQLGRAPPLPSLLLFSTDAAAAAAATATATATEEEGGHHHPLPPQPPSTPKIQPFMVGYLATTIGLPPDQVIKASKCISHIRSPKNPDSVLSFFRSKGFDAAQIRDLVWSRPTLLCASAEKTLGPKVKAFEEMGFSGPDLLLKALKRNRSIFTSSLTNRVMPNIALLRECGVPGRRIPGMMLRSRWLITRSTDTLRELIGRVEEFGFPRRTAIFEYALYAVSTLTRSNLEAKLAVLKSLGWTEEETLAAVRRAPNLMICSQEKLKMSMEFFTGEAGLEPSYVARHPVLLLISLEKRVMPRHRIRQLLRSKGLLKKELTFLSFVRMSERTFLDRFICPYVESVPGLREAYACRIPV